VVVVVVVAVVVVSSVVCICMSRVSIKQYIQMYVNNASTINEDVTTCTQGQMACANPVYKPSHVSTVGWACPILFYCS